jgi:hypothetical protein
MPFARLLALTTVLSVLSPAAMAQTTAGPAAPQVPLTQNATTAEPDMQALTPPKPTAAGMPRWSEFPHAPKNVPSVADFAARVHKEEADKGVVAAIGRAIVWEPFHPDAIVAAANAQIDPSKLAPIDPELTPAQTEALAQSLRAQVTPPPLAQ